MKERGIIVTILGRNFGISYDPKPLYDARIRKFRIKTYRTLR